MPKQKQTTKKKTAPKKAATKKPEKKKTIGKKLSPKKAAAKKPLKKKEPVKKEKRVSKEKREVKETIQKKIINLEAKPNLIRKKEIEPSYTESVLTTEKGKLGQDRKLTAEGWKRRFSSQKK